MVKPFGRMVKTGSDERCKHPVVEFCESFAICKTCFAVWDLWKVEYFVVTPQTINIGGRGFGKA